MKPTERLLGHLGRSKRQKVADLFERLHAAADIELEAHACGFVQTSTEEHGVGIADDGEVLRDRYVLLSTAWRQTEPNRHLQSRPLPRTLWLLLVNAGGMLKRPIRSWSLPDHVLEAS